jgi:hypothetical protein
LQRPWPGMGGQRDKPAGIRSRLDTGIVISMVIAGARAGAALGRPARSPFPIDRKIAPRSPRPAPARHLPLTFHGDGGRRPGQTRQKVLRHREKWRVARGAVTNASWDWCRWSSRFPMITLWRS